ncbi:MAG: hypothetical protein GTO22_15340, partial [Gemmatimonadales bacterium]|nr:hypothetical protein [Gemmatimonadales bacterium]
MVNLGIFTVDGGTGNDRLVGGDKENTWEITAGDAGTLNGSIFTSIENLIGGAVTDSFVLAAGALVTGMIDGREGDDRLKGGDAANSWIIDAANAGMFNGKPFKGIENLEGGADNDVFVLSGGSVDSVDGGGGYDSLVNDGGTAVSVTYDMIGPDSGSVDVDGQVVGFAGMESISDNTASPSLTVNYGATDDWITLSDETAGDGSMALGSFGYGTLTFRVPTDSLTIDADGGGDTIIVHSVDSGFAGSLNLLGGDGTDTVNIDTALDPAFVSLTTDAEVFNDLPAVTLGLSSTSLAEAAGAVTVTATLDRATTNEVTVNLAFAGTADGSDYAASAGQIRIAPGELTGSITLSSLDDAVVELDETAVVQIDSAVNAVEYVDQEVTATVVNDDAATLSISDVTVTEGEGATFTVTLDNDVDVGVSVDFATSDGSAVAGEDYAALSGTLSFTGTAGETQSFTVNVTGENLVELNETLIATLSNIQAGGRAVSILDGVGEATVVNDDAATLSISDVVVTEGEGATFTVTLDNDVDVGVTVDFATADGSAVAGEDYTALTGTLSFAGTAGET